MDRKRAMILVFVLLLALLALIGLLRRSQAAVRHGDKGAPAAVDVEAAPPADPANRPTAPTPESWSDQTIQGALDAIADVTGRTVVLCPKPPLESYSWMHHPSWICVSSPQGASCAAHEPAGSMYIGADQADAMRPPEAVLGWSTDEAGVTRCELREQIQGELRARVEDRDGAPIEGAVIIADHTSARTGPDGRATLTVWSADPVWLVAVGGGVQSVRVLGSPDAEARLVLAGFDPVDTGFPGQQHLDRIFESQLNALSDLEATLDAGHASADVMKLLGEQVTTAVYSLDIVCRSETPPNGCAEAR